MADNDTNSFNESRCFSFGIFFLVAGCFLLQTIGFAKQNPFKTNKGSNLYVVLPERYECNSVREIDENNNTVLTTAERGYLSFLVMEGMCVGFQAIAMFAVCSRILIFAEIFCVKCCYGCLKNVCIHCGFKWIVLEGISGILCLSGCVVLGANLSTGDISSFDGILYIILNGLLEIFKVIGAIVYHKACGCPPSDVFYGSSVKYSDVEVDKNKSEHWQEDGHGKRVPGSTYHTTDRTLRY